MSRFKLPANHRPALSVPKGGSSCSNCRFYVPVGGKYGSCVETNFARFYNTTLIPCPADEFCSDWYEPGEEVRLC